MQYVGSNGEEGGSGGDLMRIGDLARRTGTTLRTIRYYEERGLLRPAARTKGGFRLYQSEEVQRLQLIRRLQELHIPLAQVKALFDHGGQGRPAAEIAPGLKRVLEEQLETLEGQIRRLQEMQRSVRGTLEILTACAGCDREPGPVCRQCPAVAGLESVPVHMQAIIEAA